MPRACTICAHAERAAIDSALLAGQGSLRNIAQQYGLSATALFRHREHIPGALTKAQAAREVAQADTLLDQAQALQARALAILDAAERAQDLRTALGAVREARGNLELLAKLQGQLQDGPTINVMLAPQWVTLRTAILAALQPYGDARIAVAEALASLTTESQAG